ncbi:hypothetical protein K458DRAFT_392082 [Lentithecium fluviatile CBS 122367]|uniref:Uncharacterized protein n=1 Tax=Lentithecium fluviatile CBS 122367 TaxID=1168545 RepID=A0A6G1ITT8_9PLEO|nr:hypothetical protein K458DRAFT_392082 [Lentithecium fluviatile CBS 122367]
MDEFRARLRGRLNSPRNRPPVPPKPVSPPVPNIPINTDDALDQAQSPLFSAIPPEIRNQIFRLALKEYVDPEKPYDTQTYWKRPGVEGPTRIDTALMRTCKRVWGETRVLPGKEFEPIFYFGQKSRAPTEYVYIPYTHTVYGHPIMRHNRDEVLGSIKHIHIFPQMYALRTGLDRLFDASRPNLAPSRMTLTFRYTDWWNWEINEPIHPFLPNRFIEMRHIVLPPCINTLTVEFEHTESKVNQLDSVVGEMFRRRDWWCWRRSDGRKLVVRGENAKEEGAVKMWKWEGPTMFKEGHTQVMRRYPHHGQGDSMGYVVKVLTWELEKEN